VRAGTLAEARLDGDAGERPYEDLQWMSVLRSLAADQAYRRNVQMRLHGASVLRFVLQDVGFPRSVAHSLDTVASCLADLHRRDDLVEACRRTQALVDDARVRTLAWEGLGEWVDALQVELIGLHDLLADAYFSTERARPSLLLASA